MARCGFDFSRDEGELYGTTWAGGNFSKNCGGFYGPTPCGVVFRVDKKSGQETVLYSFNGPPDGWGSSAPLTFDAKGNLYGTTYHGGDFSCDPVGHGCGVVFKLRK